MQEMKIATSQTLQHLCLCKCYASQLTLRTNNCVISVSNTDWKQTSTLQSYLSSEYNGHQLLNLNKYSRTSCKQSPTMQRFSGHLHESNHMGSLPRRGPHMSTLWKKIHCMQFISVLLQLSQSIPSGVLANCETPLGQHEVMRMSTPLKLSSLH